MRRLVAVGLLAAACTNPGYELRAGQIRDIERGDKCYVTVQSGDPLVTLGPSRFEVTCDSVVGLNPGDRWPPAR